MYGCRRERSKELCQNGYSSIVGEYETVNLEYRRNIPVWMPFIIEIAVKSAKVVINLLIRKTF